MPRDHQLLVSRDDVEHDPAVARRDQRRSRSISGGIKLRAKPSKSLRDSSAHHERVLTNPCGEDKRIKSPERCRQHASAHRSMMHKVVNRECSAWITTVEELAHVIADAGQALETAPPIKEVLDLRGRHVPLRDEIEHNSGIDLSGSSAHGQAVEGSKAHRTLDTPTVRKGAHGRPASEVSNDDTLLRHIRRDLSKPIGHIFIGEAVEAVATHSFEIELLRNRKMVRNRAVATVERCVKAGNLRQLRRIHEQRANWCEVVRLMQRRQRDILFETPEHALIEEDGPIVFRSAMHNAVTYGDKVEA